MKTAWNRIVQALRGRNAAPRPLDASGEWPQDAAPLQTEAAMPASADVDAQRIHWAYLLPTASTVRWMPRMASRISA